MKLWDKGFSVDEKIDAFTVGKDREMDLFLAPYDVMGTMAHITMLEKVGLLPKEDLDVLLPELKAIYKKAAAGEFEIEPDIEDVHSQVELLLTRKLGDIGKKVHTGRSRNDQVMVDVKLFSRDRIKTTVKKVEKLFSTLQKRSEELKEILIPGYTHLQVAMPSSFGMWLGAYAESLADDMLMMKAAWDITNQNPLGAAAGYGSSAPLDRTMTTKILGFDDLDYNSVYAQMGRGKTERAISFAYACLAETVGRLAVDGCLFMSQNFGFIHLPDSLTTGSSIMPHKKNPDVFELIRAHCNRIQGIPGTIRMITGNLPSGYFRDMQIIKEVFIPLFAEMDDVLDIMDYAITNMQVVEGVMSDPRYSLAFSVEEVNRLVGEGVPLRDAYKSVGMAIQRGEFVYRGADGKSGGDVPLKASDLHHTHEGSLGNLCNDRIKQKMEKVLDSFSFSKVDKAEAELLG